jgi:HlyD family secretion protein
MWIEVAAVKNNKGIWIFLAILAVASVVGFTIWRALQADNSDVVYTATIETSEAASYVYVNGKVIAAQDRNVFAETSGVVKSVAVTLGQTVSEGDVLAVLDGQTLDQQIASARIQLSIAQENLKQIRNSGQVNFDLALKTVTAAYEDAVKSLADQQALFEAGAISQSELDMAKRQVERAETEKISTERNFNNYGKESAIRIQELSVSSARLALEQLQSQKTKLTVKAPADGVVYAINVHEGEIAAQTMPMFSISSSDDLKVTASISEYDIGQIELGQSVTIRSESFQEVYEGEISYIADVAKNLISAQAAETVVDIEVTFKDHDTKFRPNYSAAIEILTAQKESALMLPYEAVYTDRDGIRKIFVIEEGILRERVVRLGIEGDLHVEVIGENIAAGNVVALNPTETMKDGDPVKTVEVK